MFLAKKVISLPVMVMVLASAFLAQDSSFMPAYPKRDFKHNGKIISEYKVGDGGAETFVELEPVFIESSEKERTSLRLTVRYGYEGKSPTKPTSISIAFLALYPECKIPDRPEMSMLMDGESVKFEFKPFLRRLGLESPESQKRKPDEGGVFKPDEEGVVFRFNEVKGNRCNEVVAMFISQRNFLRIVKAQNVEVQIGNFRFKLKEANLEAMRDLASRMAV
ncbi:MAG TPA: hypothetical protein VEX70_11885 [Pyrinomonadaceae bacterium]|nr:hypothetical protein [Pyrinomonadaceae bacterium]